MTIDRDAVVAAMAIALKEAYGVHSEAIVAAQLEAARGDESRLDWSRIADALASDRDDAI